MLTYEKAKAEGGVLLVERWILARLRHHQFFTLAELNASIAEWLKVLNTRAFKKLEGSRLSHFEAIDRPALRPLPERPYEFAEWRKVRVAPNICLSRLTATTTRCRTPWLSASSMCV